MANINNDNIDDITKTTKQKIIRPAGIAPAPIVNQEPSLQVADPMTGRNTDTTNLDVLDDTQTRKTIKLKPLAPLSASSSQPIKIQPKAVVPVAATENKSVESNKKTITLKPLNKSIPTPEVKIAPPNVANEDDDTQTRPQATIKPVPTPKINLAPANNSEDDDTQTRPQATIKPVPTPKINLAPTNKSEDDDTQTRPQAVIKPSGTSAINISGAEPVSEDDTIKIKKRPMPTLQTNKVAPAPAPAPVANEAASKATVQLPQTPVVTNVPEPVDSEKDTIKLQKMPPIAKVPAPAKDTINLQTEPIANEAPTASEENEVVDNSIDNKNLSEKLIISDNLKLENEAPSKLQLITAIVALLFVVVGTSLTAISYFNIWEYANIQIPGL